MRNTNDIIGAFLPSIESWMRGLIADEVSKALEREAAKKRVEKTYTRDEVCELAHITKPTLWQRVKDGKIKPLPGQGRRIIFSQSEVKKFLEGTK